MLRAVINEEGLIFVSAESLVEDSAFYFNQSESLSGDSDVTKGRKQGITYAVDDNTTDGEILFFF